MQNVTPAAIAALWPGTCPAALFGFASERMRAATVDWLWGLWF